MWHRSKKPASNHFKPALCVLEDRTTPSTYRIITGGPAVNLEVIAPKQVTAGPTVNIEVEAVDGAGRVSAGFTGTVDLSLGDGGTELASYTFTGKDRGVHVFQVALTSVGTQALFAQDMSATTTIEGGTYTTVVPGAASHFGISAASAAAVGAPTSVTIAAMDAYGNVVTSFTGVVRLSAAGSNLPATYTFTAANKGAHAFNVTFTTPGSETITATAAAKTSITGDATLTVYPANQATELSVTVLGDAYPGEPTAVEVTALNAAGQTATGYTGTVHLTSTDPFASMLGSYTFTAADQGSYIFSVIFAEPGVQTVTATDVANAALTGSASVNVISSLYDSYYDQMAYGAYGYGNYPYGSGAYGYGNYPYGIGVYGYGNYPYGSGVYGYGNYPYGYGSYAYGYGNVYPYGYYGYGIGYGLAGSGLTYY